MRIKGFSNKYLNIFDTKKVMTIVNIKNGTNPKEKLNFNKAMSDN